MLTQDEYKLYTNETVNYSVEDWQKLVSMAAVRLAGFLCLEELPTDENGKLPDKLAMLLANFLCLMLAKRGSNAPITSKHVRNFTINFGSDAANAFAKLEENYGDIIADYSQCGTGVCVERSSRRCCCERF